MHTRTLSVMIMMSAAFASAQTPQSPLVGKAHDGGALVYDGICYHYTDPDRFKGMTLWLPPGRKAVRGIILNGNPGSTGDSRPSAIRPAMQHIAAQLGFGWCGVTCFPGRQVYRSGGETILKVLKDWAQMGLHPELANLPLLPRGNSNGGMTAYALTCYAPQRVIAYTNNVGVSFAPERPSLAAMQVPALHHPGPVDPLIRMGFKATTELFWDISPKGALWAWDAEEGKGHQIGSSMDIDLPFMQRIVPMRLPADANPRKAPVALIPLKRNEGFLTDTGTWHRYRRPDGTTGPTYVAPAGDFRGDREHASWLPDSYIAALYQATATYDQPLTLRLEQSPDAPDPDGVVLIEDKEA